MNKEFINKLRKQLTNDEGIRFEIYPDHLGYPTFGIGHLVKKDDIECGLPCGTKITKERVYEVFKKDIKITLEECQDLFEDFITYPQEVQLILANMMFNIGKPRLSKFKKMRKAIEAEDWVLASQEMLNSRWARQVPNRANRLIKRMKRVGSFF